MIFAAGRGTRLGEIGERTPKALIEVGGRTMIEHVAAPLLRAGADRFIVNVHHHAGMIEARLRTLDLGAPVVLSHETEEPLETGGGLLHAQSLFRGDAPFFLCNVDIITLADLGAMYRAHLESSALATLAVNDRESRRRLLFDEDGLYGRVDTRQDVRIEARPSRGDVLAWPFAGIHVVSPGFLELLTERGKFSILEPYLRLAADSRAILPFDLGHVLWLEIGEPERLDAARARYTGSAPPP
jgi:N-acetyl-alpha-D-muramate 1-phosphate uridylyltransferase